MTWLDKVGCCSYDSERNLMCKGRMVANSLGQGVTSHM